MFSSFFGEKPAKRGKTEDSECAELIDRVNAAYDPLHTAFEEQFWGTKMNLSDPKYTSANLTKTKVRVPVVGAAAARRFHPRFF